MSLMLKHAIDDAFARMALLYGREFTARFDDLDLDKVKAEWCRELAACVNVLDGIAWALRSLPDRCPNAPQFRRLVEALPRAPRQAMADSDEPVRAPTQIERELLRDLRDRAQSAALFAKPSRQWAHDLVGSGERAGLTAMRMARDVVEGRRAQKHADEFHKGETAP